MNAFTFSHNGKEYKRVNKPAAKKAYMAGSTVYITACNMSPVSVWGTAYPANRADRAEFVADEIGSANDFYNLVNSFEYYNCNAETGYYAAFYIATEPAQDTAEEAERIEAKPAKSGKVRTNSKAARQAVRAYILDGFTPEGYDNAPEEGATFEEVAAFILDTFQDERRYCRGADAALFTDWAQGLPSIIDTCYYYNRPAVADLAEILQETPEEAARYTEEQAAELLTWLIYRELRAATR